MIDVILRSLAGVTAVAAFLLPRAGVANDIQPRLYTNIPVGTNFLSFGYVRSEGNVSVDPSIALDVTAEMDTWVAGYGRAFGLWGRSATLSVAVPYADLTLSGIVNNEFVTANDAQFADPSIRLAVNLAGAPALSKQEFAAYSQETIIGFNVKLTAPLGNYQPARRVNFGANRWSIAPEIGISHRRGKFTFEGALTAIVFTDNDEYLVDSTLEQEPVGLLRANVLYHFDRPGTWFGIGGLFLRGGQISIDGSDSQNLQSRSRVGAAFAFPVAQRHAFQLLYSRGVTTRIGADFDNYSLSYTYIF